MRSPFMVLYWLSHVVPQMPVISADTRIELRSAELAVIVVLAGTFADGIELL